MKEIIDWFTQNWPYLLSAFFGVIVIASIIVKLTKTTEDDAFMNKVIAFLDKFSIAKTDSDKKLLEIAKEKLAVTEEGDKTVEEEKKS